MKLTKIRGKKWHKIKVLTFKKKLEWVDISNKRCKIDKSLE